MLFVDLACILSIFPTLTEAVIQGTAAKVLEASKGIVLIDIGYEIHDPPYCNGALITNEFVLTSGKCCAPEFTRTMVHVCSTTPFEAGGQYYPVLGSRVMGASEDPAHKICVIRLGQQVDTGPYCVPLGLSIHPPRLGDTEQLYHVLGYGSIYLLPPQESTASLMYHRILATELQALEFPRIEDRFCDKYYETGRRGDYNLSCHGDHQNFRRRIMPDDMGAPVVGSKDNVVYTILNSQGKFKTEIEDWVREPFPFYGVDVFSARADILRAMIELRKLGVFK